jgi:serine/threonine protein kinase
VERDEGHRSARPGGGEREPSSELLGPYALLTELSRGELTTVHLAKKHGPLGFKRLVAVKRLRPQYSGHEDSVGLLLHEARLTGGLRHANLVGVLDVGSEGGCYVVSDYVEGENLERLLGRAGAAGDPRYVLPILIDVLNGLHAVHNAFGEDELPLHMVHQAPCARHILVGVDGIGRLTDFSQMQARSIAPSRVRSERLRVPYMAPEQALNPERVDHRADLFIVGITLWEALTGERLFAGDSDERAFQNLLHRRIPRPSEVGFRSPRIFDAVCMRALERDPAARYGSAYEMARDLRDAALNQALYAPPGEIGAWVKRIMGRDLADRRRKLGDMDSQEISLASTRAGGFLDALHGEDPYRTGRIYGGSHSMTMNEDGFSVDPDKTPSLGVRRGTFPIPNDDDADRTAPRFLGFSGTLEAGVPAASPRTRISTLPYGAFSDEPGPTPDPAAVPTASAGSAVVERPKVDPRDYSSSDVLDAEHTQPGTFVPSAVGARRHDSKVPSPGAYSQVAAGRRSQAPRAPGSVMASAPEVRVDARAPVSERDRKRTPRSLPPPAAAFEDLDTGRFDSMPARPSAPPSALGRGTAFPAVMSQQPASDTRATSRPPPYPRRSQPALETGPALVTRQDSVPNRRLLPAEPVGLPHAPALTAEPLAASPAAEGLPKTFEALRQSVPPGTALVLSPVNVPNSLTPPNRSEHTLPPAENPPARSAGVWVLSGVLAAIILLAAGVGLRQWAGSEPHAAASPVVARDDEALAPAREIDGKSKALDQERAAVAAPVPAEAIAKPAAVAPAREPAVVVATQASPDASPISAPGAKPLKATKPAAANAAAAVTPGLAAHPKPARVEAAPLERAPEALRTSEPAEPVLAAPAAAKHVRKAPAKSAIPDNPY